MFKQNLDAHFPGSTTPFIIMNGVNFTHLKHVIDFMYQGEVRVVDSDLEGVLTLGESLQVRGLCSLKMNEKFVNDVKNNEPSVSHIAKSDVESNSRIDSQYVNMPNSKVLNNPPPLTPSPLAYKSMEENRNLSDSLNSTQNSIKIRDIKSVLKTPKHDKPIIIDGDKNEPDSKRKKLIPSLASVKAVSMFLIYAEHDFICLFYLSIMHILHINCFSKDKEDFDILYKYVSTKL